MKYAKTLEVLNLGPIYIVNATGVCQKKKRHLFYINL